MTQWRKSPAGCIVRGREHVGYLFRKPLEMEGVISGKSQVRVSHLRLAASAEACVIIKADYIIRRPAPIHDVWTMYNTGISTLLYSSNHHSKYGSRHRSAIRLGKPTSQPKHYAVMRTVPHGRHNDVEEAARWPEEEEPVRWRKIDEGISGISRQANRWIRNRVEPDRE
jgi:hypothetical protein